MRKGSKEKLIFYDQLRDLLDDLNIGVFTVDSQRRITSFNRAVQLLTGYKADEVIGKYCYQVFHNDLCKGECKFHEAVEAEQVALSFNVEILDLNKERRLISKLVMPLYDSNRELTGCVEIFQDHSIFEELVNRISFDERRLKSILDSLEIGIFTTTRGGHITFFNRRAEAITGFDRKDILGKPCSVILEGKAARGKKFLDQSIRDGRPRSVRKLLLRKRAGENIPVEANYMALKNDRGAIIGGLVTIQDLSLIDRLSREISKRYTFDDMVGKSPPMQRIFEVISVAAPTDTTLLIEGPTGTGKDLLAKIVHNSSKRADKAFVKVNCAALPEGLLESEMFGYLKGAFTGADQDKPGRFQEAEGGTIFLDEIGDLPLTLQGKLLRVLEDREFYPLGSRRTTKVDVRIIAATNQDLEDLVARKKFREDLFYRLNVIRVQLPALKERKGDIPLLIEHLLKKLSLLKGRNIPRISGEAMEILLNYEYPGNIRELENILEHAIIICQGDIIEPRHLPLFLQDKAHRPEPSDLTIAADLRGTLQEGEKRRIYEVLSRHNWNRSKAARELNINRTTLWRKMRKYKLLGDGSHLDL
ncbi:MAG: sigma 54-interacting transcriptional regulator [Deltaproteobacteria bacterium]|nr:sigma 54-interacting transcriptional regulator [Deltaproteobacteria bacterium]